MWQMANWDHQSYQLAHTSSKMPLSLNQSLVFFSPIYTVFQHACYYFKAMCLEVVISSTLSYECEWKGKSPVHLLICICLFMSSTVSGPLSVFSRVEWMAGKGISGPSESARASSQPKAKCLVLQQREELWLILWPIHYEAFYINELFARCPSFQSCGSDEHLAINQNQRQESVLQYLIQKSLPCLFLIIRFLCGITEPRGAVEIPLPLSLEIQLSRNAT